MASSDRFIQKIKDTAADCLAICNRAEQRGFYTADELRKVDRCEFSQLPIYQTAYELACEHEGKRARWSVLTPKSDVRARKGLYVSNAGGRYSIHIYGTIGQGDFDGVSAQDIKREFDSIPAQASVDLHVHSDGGSFSDAVAIVSLIRNRAGETHGFVDGLAASAASLILMGCTSISMAKHSRQMIHFASVNTSGSLDADELEVYLRVIQETNDAILEMYTHRWKASREELISALKATTYYTAQQAAEVGLADYITESAKVAPYGSAVARTSSKEFSIAACRDPRKMFTTRRATMRLWELAADEFAR